MYITRRSAMTGQTHTVDLPVTDAQMHEMDQPMRRSLSEIFPNLSLEEREFIRTGITPEEWREAFGDDEP